LSHPGIHASRDTIARSLEGTWWPDLLFVLQQEVTTYDAYLQRIDECDQALEQHLKTFADKDGNPAASSESVPPTREPRRTGPKRRRKAGSHTPQFDLGQELHRISGVDKGLQYYEERHRQQQVQLLKKRAAKLGLHIVESEAA
jgi:transposase